MAGSITGAFELLTAPRIAAVAATHGAIVATWCAWLAPDAEPLEPGPDSWWRGFVTGAREGGASGCGQILHGWWMTTTALCVMLPAIIPGDASLTTGEWFGVVLRVAGGIALAAVFYPLMSSLIPAMICVAMAGGLWLGAGKYASIVEAPIATTIHPWTLAIGVVACFAVSLMIALLITLASGVVGRLRGELSWNWERHSRTQRFIGVFLNVVVAGYLPYLWYVTTLKS